MRKKVRSLRGRQDLMCPAWSVDFPLSAGGRQPAFSSECVRNDGQTDGWMNEWSISARERQIWFMFKKMSNFSSYSMAPSTVGVLRGGMRPCAGE